jgi:hypothetical protein
MIIHQEKKKKFLIIKLKIMAQEPVELRVLKSKVEVANEEVTKFYEKGVKASARRARVTLSEVSKLCKVLRAKILEDSKK